MGQSTPFTYYTKGGSLGEADWQFDGQNDVDFYSGKVYVADYANHRIQIFDPEGNFIIKFGEGGEGDGQFYKVSALSIDSEGDIYVADQFNYRVQKFTNDGKFIKAWGSNGAADGQFLEKFGQAGAGDGQLNGPEGVGVDKETGTVYVADTGNSRIQVFKPIWEIQDLQFHRISGYSMRWIIYSF